MKELFFVRDNTLGYLIAWWAAIQERNTYGESLEISNIIIRLTIWHDRTKWEKKLLKHLQAILKVLLSIMLNTEH